MQKLDRPFQLSILARISIGKRPRKRNIGGDAHSLDASALRAHVRRDWNHELISITEPRCPASHKTARRLHAGDRCEAIFLRELSHHLCSSRRVFIYQEDGTPMPRAMSKCLSVEKN